MFSLPSKRTVAKNVAEILVFSTAIEASQEVIDRTIAPESETTSEIGAMASGTVIYYTMLHGRASRAIDRVADWRVARKEAKAANAAE